MAVPRNVENLNNVNNLLLPWTFLYEVYLRFSYIVRNLWLPWDQLLHDLLYALNIVRIKLKI